MKIFLRDVKACLGCNKGARAFLIRHRLMSWQEFLDNGIDSKLLIGTNDQMAIDIVNNKRAKYGRKHK